MVLMQVAIITNTFFSFIPSLQSSIGRDEAEDHEKPSHVGGGRNGQQ